MERFDIIATQTPGIIQFSNYEEVKNALSEYVSAFTDIDTGLTEYGYQMAASFCVTVPLFLLFIFFRKYIMRGVGRAGIKG